MAQRLSLLGQCLFSFKPFPVVLVLNVRLLYMAVYTDKLITLVEHKYFLDSLHSFFIDLLTEIGLECEAKY